MNAQNYANHARFVKGYHFVLSSLLVLGTIASIVNTWRQWSAHDNVFSAILITVLFVCGVLLAAFVRQFPLKAQDRVIRAEENMRFYILKGRPLDSRLTMDQVIALRFAPDDEFVILADRAVNETLSPTEIKQAIKQWRADHHRM